MGILAGPKARREPAGEAKPDACVISDGEAGAFCTVGLVLTIPKDDLRPIQMAKRRGGGVVNYL